MSWSAEQPPPLLRCGLGTSVHGGRRLDSRRRRVWQKVVDPWDDWVAWIRGVAGPGKQWHPRTKWIKSWRRCFTQYEEPKFHQAKS
ncbi:hypothetical protein SORBI_3003G079750 [Sorghum bicolor]|uniref:Uncharacterized protein n=1 Tax=Sorghum bicolor TaxID=4558 RepID=A0A1W0VW67_SORBI|nr:hypothetical protein SORBI_3003G079750 [Sorghum bicolor]